MNICHRIIINAPAEQVYEAITTQDGLAGWWTSDIKVKPAVGNTARFSFGPSYFKEMVITALMPGKQVKWNCVTGAGEWIGTDITFQLQSGDSDSLLAAHPEMEGQLQQQKTLHNGTLLIFNHNNWKEATPMYAECNYTWGQFLKSLKLFCETGKGLPWPQQHQ
jgi:uncharacterized protein YndB with AHSA1/START domain